MKIEDLAGRMLTAIKQKDGEFILVFDDVTIKIGACPVGYENSIAYLVLPDGSEIIANDD